MPREDVEVIVHSLGEAGTSDGELASPCEARPPRACSEFVRKFSLVMSNALGTKFCLVTYRRLFLGLVIVTAAYLMLMGIWHQSIVDRMYPKIDSNVVDHELRLSTHRPSPSLIKPLKKLCDSKTVDPGLVFSCYEVGGGLGNLNTFVLECVRYAIQAGAGGLVIPRIQTRSPTDISILIDGTFVDFSHMFDEDWFRKSLELSCPRMKIYRHIVDVPHFKVARIPDRVSVLEIGAHRPDALFNRHPETFQEDLKKHLGPAPPKVGVHFREDPDAQITPPTIIRLRAKIFEFPARTDPDDLWASFGRIIRFKQDAYDLAENALLNLRRMNSDSRGVAKYLGFHLRVESDVSSLGEWPKYEELRDLAFSYAKSRRSSIIYVASGDKQQLKRIQKEAAKEKIKVVTKFDLLRGSFAEQLQKMSWDQQAMVDYLILRSSTYFVGTSPSSFSYALAYARHLEIAEPGNSKFPYPEDKLSHLNGDKLDSEKGGEFRFPKHGMWPLEDKVGRTK